MKQLIRKICKDLEKKHNITILFAIENGSRAWGMESKDSDYDVRFVYYRPMSEYITIKKSSDIINAAFDTKGKSCNIENALIDVVGFDIFKFTTLLSASNPTTIEWLTSNIVYYGKQNKVFKSFATNYFNPKTLYFHYRSMCHNNYTKYIQSQNHVTHKKYLYTFRGLCNALWVIHNKSIPPIVFIQTLNEIAAPIPKHITSTIKKIIAIKTSGKEKDPIPNIFELDTFIEHFLNQGEPEFTQIKEKKIEILDSEMRRIILHTKK